MEARKYFKGIIIVAVLAILAIYIQYLPAIKNLGISAIIIAILIGIGVKNTVGTCESMNEGIRFCAKKVLRLAIILLGFKLSLMEVSKLGLKAIILIFIVTIATLLFTKYIGQKLKLSRSLSLLVGAGTSICGASAIVAVNSVTKSDNDEELALSVGVVTIFGTIFMLIYPVIGYYLHLSTTSYSLWAGSSIHEVAQAVAAGFTFSNQAGVSATIVKLTRVLMLIPVTIILSIREEQRNNTNNFSIKNVSIPWFVLLFLCVVFLNTTNFVPKAATETLINIDNFLMAMAMVALGLETSFEKMKKVGIKPIYLGAVSSIFISILSLIVIKIMSPN